MLLHSPLHQQPICGHLPRTALCRSQWLASLRRRVAAAPKDASLVASQQTAATGHANQQAASGTSSSEGAPPSRHVRRTIAQHPVKDGSAVSEQDPAAVELEHAPLARPVGGLEHAAGAEGSGMNGRVRPRTEDSATAPCSVGSRNPGPESPAAALKQRRVAAAAAKQHQLEAANTASPSNRHKPNSRHDGSTDRSQLQRNRQPRLRRASQQSLQDTRLKPALQQLLQQMQSQQCEDGASDLLSHLHERSNQRQLSQNHQQQLSAVAQLTQLIQRTDHPRQLVHILVTGAGSLNAVHITAAAEQLLVFVRQTQQMHVDDEQTGIFRTKVKAAYKQLCKVVTAHLLDLDTRAVISLLRCFSKLAAVDQRLLPQQLWGDLLHISTNMMDEVSPQQLAMLVYAVAQADRWAQAKPSRRWWLLFFESSQYNMSGFTPQGFANVVWAMGKLQRRPGADWAAALYKETEAQLGLFTPQGLANMGSGLGHMNGLGLAGLPRPSQRWMQAYLAAAVQQLDGFSSQGLANLLWALARLGYCPPKDSIKALTTASLAQLPRSSAQDLSLMVYSFAVLKVKLPEQWWSRYWPVSVDKLEQAGSQALANTFYALGKHRRVPPTFWLLAFLPAMQRSLPHCSPQAAANVLWAAGQLRPPQLPGAWLDTVLDRVYQQLQDAKPVELSGVLLALKRLQHKPSQKWLEGFLAASQPRLASFTAPQLCGILEALAVLTPNCSPSAAWSAAVLAQVSARLPTMRAPELTAVIWGLCELRIMPSKDVLSRFMGASAENLHLMDGAMLSRMLRTLVRLGQRPNTDWLFLLVEESYYHLSVLQPQQLADFVWGFGQLRYNPGPSWLARVLETASQQLPGFSPAALVRLLQGLAGLRLEPGVEWLGPVGYRVQKMLGEMTAQELLQCVAALERLGLGPGAVLMQQLSVGALNSPAAAQAIAQAALAAGSALSSPKAVALAKPGAAEVVSDSSSMGAPPGAAVVAAPVGNGASAGTAQELKRPQLPRRQAATDSKLAATPASTSQAQQTAANGSYLAPEASDSCVASQLQDATGQDGHEQGAESVDAGFAAECIMDASKASGRTAVDGREMQPLGPRCAEQQDRSSSRFCLTMSLLPRPERPRRAPPLPLPLVASR